MTECLDSCPDNARYAYPHGHADKSGQCSDQCDDGFYRTEGTSGQTLFCSNCTDGYHVPSSDTTVECMAKCPAENEYAYRHNSSSNAGECTNTCQSGLYVVDAGDDSVQTKFCDECQDGYHIAQGGN